MTRTHSRTLPIIYTPRHQSHVPRIELSQNFVVDHPEVPERVEVMARALRQAGHADSFVEPLEYSFDSAAKVHDESLIAFLEQTTTRLAKSDESSVLETPYTISPDTPLAANTLMQAWLASCVVLTGANMLLSGHPCVYALERPPGHHAGRYKYGGYCYINHAAVAAHTLKPHGRVAVLDIDFHHGNGTQEIFYDTDEVLYVSLHGHPAWAYPRFSGWPEETGSGAGENFNLNLPLPMFTANEPYLGILRASAGEDRLVCPRLPDPLKRVRYPRRRPRRRLLAHRRMLSGHWRTACRAISADTRGTRRRLRSRRPGQSGGSAGGWPRVILSEQNQLIARAYLPFLHYISLYRQLRAVTRPIDLTLLHSATRSGLAISPPGGLAHV